MSPETGEGKREAVTEAGPLVLEALTGQAYVRTVSGTGIRPNQQEVGQPAQMASRVRVLAGSRWKL